MVSSYHCLLLSLQSIDVPETHRDLDSDVVRSLAETLSRGSDCYSQYQSGHKETAATRWSRGVTDLRLND